MPVLLVVVVGLSALSLPALDMRLGMPSDGTAATTTTQRRAYDDLARAFGPGFNGPLVVVADLAGAGNARTAATTIQTDLAAVPGVVYASPATLTPTGHLAIYTLIPVSSPADQATEDLVHTLRAHAVTWRDTGAAVYVTGATAAIMISVFAGFILTDETTIKSMGFALAIGVFFDAFAVRMALVPAVMSLLGEKAWWIPRWLDRVLPDVEGERLARMLAVGGADPVLTSPLPPTGDDDVSGGHNREELDHIH